MKKPKKTHIFHLESIQNTDPLSSQDGTIPELHNISYSRMIKIRERYGIQKVSGNEIIRTEKLPKRDFYKMIGEINLKQKDKNIITLPEIKRSGEYLTDSEIQKIPPQLQQIFPEEFVKTYISQRPNTNSPLIPPEYVDVIINKAKQLQPLLKSNLEILSNEFKIDKANIRYDVFKSNQKDIVELYKAGLDSKQLSKIYHYALGFFDDYSKIEKYNTMVNSTVSQIRSFTEAAKVTRTHEDLNRKYKYNENFFEKIDSGPKAYWLGFITADGCNTHSDGHPGYHVRINLQIRDKSLLERFNSDLQANLPISKVTYKNSIQAKIEIGSKKMAQDLIEKGVTPAKSFTIQFPSTNVVPTEFVPQYIRGFFDGDGSFYYKNHRGKAYPEIAFYTASREYIESIKSKMETMLSLDPNKVKDYDKTIVQPQVSKAYHINWTGNVVAKAFFNYLYDDVLKAPPNEKPPYLERKFEHFKLYLDCLESGIRDIAQVDEKMEQLDKQKGYIKEKPILDDPKVTKFIS